MPTCHCYSFQVKLCLSCLSFWIRLGSQGSIAAGPSFLTRKDLTDLTAMFCWSAPTLHFPMLCSGEGPGTESWWYKENLALLDSHRLLRLPHEVQIECLAQGSH